MLRWFDDARGAGHLHHRHASWSSAAWNRWLERHTGIARRARRSAAPLFDVVPALGERGLDAHYRAALGGESRVLAHRFHRYLVPARAGRRADAAERAHRAARRRRRRSSARSPSSRTSASASPASASCAARSTPPETARAHAEEAVRVKDEFLATLSHEIRTPLNAVLGWTKILLGAPGRSAMLTRALEVIDRNAVAQTRLIDDMLDMARIMSGKLRLDMQPVDLASIALDGDRRGRARRRRPRASRS